MGEYDIRRAFMSQENCNHTVTRHETSLMSHFASCCWQDIMCQLFSQNWNFHIRSWLGPWEAPFGLGVWISVFSLLFLCLLCSIIASVFISIWGQSVLFSLFCYCGRPVVNWRQCQWVCVHVCIFSDTLFNYLTKCFWLSCFHRGVVWGCFCFPVFWSTID